MKMLRFGGESEYFNPDGTVKVMGTKKCWHCQRPIEVELSKKLLEKMDYCRSCNRLICLEHCYPIYMQRGCLDHRREIEKVEERHYRSQQFAKAMGFR